MTSDNRLPFTSSKEAGKSEKERANTPKKERKRKRNKPALEQETDKVKWGEGEIPWRKPSIFVSEKVFSDPMDESFIYNMKCEGATLTSDVWGLCSGCSLFLVKSGEPIHHTRFGSYQECKEGRAYSGRQPESGLTNAYVLNINYWSTNTACFTCVIVVFGFVAACDDEVAQRAGLSQCLPKGCR
ncbi:hypothetical protein NPIL_519961 [Nephila pilipes]|uniref:Uncharacterized protein n=1 Tax=Nephila pilipes TaxID=299642 RepID=A0A8X6QB31_NEPPI|nr:hypothetical protein NPIL_519961 [Nephila pilipes]